MTAYSPEAWETFAAANAGAAAALAGLLFVGVTINVEAIVESRRLAGRALEAFVLLASVLVGSVLVLVPAITTTGLGIALVVAGVVVWVIVSVLHARSVPALGGEVAQSAPPSSNAVRILLGQAATVPTIAAAITLLAESGGGSTGWSPASCSRTSPRW